MTSQRYALTGCKKLMLVSPISGLYQNGVRHYYYLWRKLQFMKKASLIVIVAAVCFYSCGRKSEDHSQHNQHEGSATADPNKPLSDSVMDVHNQVMPKMGEIIRLTESLRDKVAKTPDMSAAKKQEIEAAIDSLDAASEGMMDWMHKFKPEAQADDQVRQYLKNELVRVAIVKQRMLSAIEKGNSLQ